MRSFGNNNNNNNIPIGLQARFAIDCLLWTDREKSENTLIAST